jgi:histone H3/H4
MVNVKLLPLAAMEKIIKKAGGPDIRVSDKAKVALKSIIEEKAEDIAERAWRFASHAGRKTVKAADIKLAVNK